MHPNCLTVRVQLLNGGYTDAKVMLVNAIGENHAPLEPTIVKIAKREELEKEIIV